MVGITGAPEVMMVGGAVSTGGAKPGIYRCIVTDAATGMSKGDEEKGRPPRPFVELEFAGKGDPEHPTKEGKKVTKQKFYGASGSDDPDKKKMMNGMLKRSVYDGLGLKWPTEGKALDPRIFVKKECFIAIGLSKADAETGDQRPEVQAIAIERAKLPKKFLEAQPKAEADGEEAAASKPAKKASRN